MSEKQSGRQYIGNVADWYDAFLSTEQKEVDIYRDVLGFSKSPVLEINCGTGRLLTEYLKEGIEIHGMESSEFLLEKCKQKLDLYRLQTTLYNQKPEDLNLPQKYNTIFVAGGSFQLLDSYDKAMDTLERIFHHLNNGGKLILDLYIPWNQIQANNEGVWRIGRTAEKPETSERVVVHYAERYDIKNQIRKMYTKYEFYQRNRLLDTQFDVVNIKWYAVNEFVLMLEKAGFNNIYTEDKSVLSSHGISTLYYAYKLS